MIILYLVSVSRAMLVFHMGEYPLLGKVWSLQFRAYDVSFLIKEVIE
jgi:hypothetical protein